MGMGVTQNRGCGMPRQRSRRDREGEAKSGQVKERWNKIHCGGEKGVDALEA